MLLNWSDTSRSVLTGSWFICLAAAFSVAIGLIVIATPTRAAEDAFIQAVSASPPPSGARRLCQQYAWACASRGSVSLSPGQEMKIVQRVNRQVNSTTRSVTDQSQYRAREWWALPTSRGGDCEDFALLKKRELINAGLDPKKLLIATVLDTQRNAHAVLVYRSSVGDLILDNLTNRIKPWGATNYLFLRMQDPKRPQRWVGVYASS